jgi:hypothetical protein
MLWQRLLGGPASENGRLRHGDGDSEGGNRCRRGLVLTTLSPAHHGQPDVASRDYNSRLRARQLPPAITVGLHE